MPYGYNGKILRVDLTNTIISTETPDELFYRRYMGGKGFALYYLLRETKSNIDPLSPESMLIFAPSIITGAPAPAIPRYTVAGKSPMTGGFGESEAGGTWGPEFKRTGFDMIIITGKASKPVYLYITDDKAEIRDASHLWGKDTGVVQDELRRELNEQQLRVAAIGIAGENLVRYACILNDLVSANGRNGFGAVMGSKNLKAIAARGKKEIQLYNPEKVKEVAKWVAVNFKNLPGSKASYEYGTAAAAGMFSSLGMLPTRNFAAGTFADVAPLSGDSFKSKYISKKGCYACPIGCKKFAAVQDDRFQVESRYGSPEYETIAAFGSNLEISDLNAVLKANELCNKYGLDTISMGTTIAFAMECYENGLISDAETGGLNLSFGNVDAMLAAIELTARRQGFGAVLAEGSKRMAALIGKGSEKYSFSVKGLELAMHDPRVKYAVGIGYAVSHAGPDHMSIPYDTFFQKLEVIRNNGMSNLTFLEPVELLGRDSRKTKIAVYGQMLWSSFNALGACLFGIQPRGIISLDMFIELIKAITGFDVNLFEIMATGHRTVTLARIFNLREGFTAADDTLPDRAFEPITEGALKGTVVKKEDLAKSLREYYSLMGWNRETGVPYPETLAALDIEWAGELIN